MSSDRDRELDRSYAVLTDALCEIRNRFDCDYVLDPEASRPTPCPCPKCTAIRALENVHAWRFQGAHHARTRKNWREQKLHEAWARFADDRALSLILDQGGETPTPRDWFVASTIIQWLGTNVGMCILTESGFKYTKWDEDRAREERE